ncbi:uncharacterized protein SETTUDRAFT_36669 [Exserohilum turcica Et28A]|uniref:Uncharacterized protein n=1 Tax=Exserohilum turcicum (strain 28A) TaxID=671987 RepID=R0KLJ3_EXST2|nr:uncharacterized protein SETTUDRAFT_36669 [Exserohilum turcica Et28A]EOA90004.1 hypothetical protein SETTUDRAFT_36669 [Exserohilum turcica Et28A]
MRASLLLLLLLCCGQHGATTTTTTTTTCAPPRQGHNHQRGFSAQITLAPCPGSCTCAAKGATLKQAERPVAPGTSSQSLISFVSPTSQGHVWQVSTGPLIPPANIEGCRPAAAAPATRTPSSLTLPAIYTPCSSLSLPVSLPLSLRLSLYPVPLPGQSTGAPRQSPPIVIPPRPWLLLQPPLPRPLSHTPPATTDNTDSGAPSRPFSPTTSTGRPFGDRSQTAFSPQSVRVAPPAPLPAPPATIVRQTANAHTAHGAPVTIMIFRESESNNMGRGAYDTTGTPKPTSPPQPK